jgi:hypothetical protein
MFPQLLCTGGLWLIGRIAGSQECHGPLLPTALGGTCNIHIHVASLQLWLLHCCLRYKSSIGALFDTKLWLLLLLLPCPCSSSAGEGTGCGCGSTHIIGYIRVIPREGLQG